MNHVGRIVLQAILLVLMATVLALVTNALRTDGLSLVATGPFAIYKECPLMSKAPKSIGLEELKTRSDWLFIDARGPVQFQQSHIPGARNVPYHPLNPIAQPIVDNLRTVGPNRLLVYGDTQIDSGRLLAAELAAAGCLGVRYLQGGFAAWTQASRKLESGGSP